MRFPYFNVVLLLLHSAFHSNAQWKNFIEVDVKEGQPEQPERSEQPKGYIVYDQLPYPTGGEEYSLFYAQTGDSLDKVKLFTVSPSGVVRTVQPLIYEKGKSNEYDLTIVKRPRNEKNGGLATTVRVKVQDVNNFSPVFAFEMYNGTIKENSPADTIVMGLENCHAEDRDTSGIRAYKIIKGNEKGYFKAEKRDVGEKSFLQLKATKNPLQRGKNTPYMTLVVEAEDMGNPPLTARTTIRVVIEEVNDHTPVFDKSSYERAISEDFPQLMPVLKVQATDQDEGVNGQVYYFFQTLSSFFTIDVFTGVITLVRELDYSQTAQRLHQLTVLARDGGAPSKQTSASVTITVPKDIPNFPFPASPSDSQENTAPFFPNAPYHFTIHTSFPAKGSLGVIFAVNEDPPGPNSELRYSLVSASGDFSIDTFSGVLTVNKELNPKTYTLAVQVQDQGSPSKRAQAQVKIEVEDLDYSPNYPKFSDPIQVLKVAENVEVGKSVFLASVISDSSTSKGVVYSAIFGSGLPYFELDETTGVMKTAAPLDRETHAVYDVMIEARNKEKLPRHSYLYLTIDITNVDEAYPDFAKPAYDASVPEGSPKGTFVTVIHAIDKDDLGVSYNILNLESVFEIESNTGAIRTKRVLDRATGDREFLLYVTANDGGGKTSQAIVNIKVTSSQNSKPKFKKESYEVTLKERQSLSNLLCIAATASDGAVKYSIQQGGDKRIQIGHLNGTLYVTDSFDYKYDRGYVVQVEAKTDSFPKAESTKVTVTIENEDEPPIFLKNSYDISTQENVAVGTKLLVDDTYGFRFSTDEKPVSDFDCTLEDITAVEILDHFQVERMNSECQLLVIKNFVQVPNREFKFQVRVTNVKQLNLFGSATVTVKITDTNDYPPEFSQSSYWVTVPTTTPTGTSLLQVAATDRDTQGSADIVLELLSESAPEDLSRFQIDSQGILRTASSNLPENTLFNFKVKAKETGTDQPKGSEVSLKISVLSAPFVPVTFESASYSKSLPEDASVSSTVFTVKASRSGSDTGIKYSIVGGNSDNTFTVNSDTGKITLAKELDYETKKSHKLIIRATFPSSNNVPEVTAEVAGEVVVTNVNDNKPRFLLYHSVTRIAIDSYTPSATTVLQVTATDEDTVDKPGGITYTINEAISNPSSNIPFSLNRNTGQLKTNREIRFSEGSSYMLVIRATDGGRKESATTIQITVLDTNKPPAFKQDEYVKIISENSPVGTTVIDIKADYGDSSALLKYSFIQGNQDNMFCIDYLGVISVARPLDRESVPSYELSVMVSLNNKNDTTVVKVTLSDTNDYAPVFEKSLFIIEVPENQAVNSDLRLLTATDGDDGDNGRVTYSILQTVMDESKNVFAIESSSGMVKLKISLNREKVAEHTLYIKAQDNGNPELRLSDITKLIIRVTDVNDNIPRFSTTSYQASIPVNAKPGDRVVQLSATDLDSGVNRLIYYSITEGNNYGVFAIDNTNGLITLGKTSVASVAKESFTLTVEASDEKDRSKKDTATVLVNVFPADGPPHYPDPSLSFTIKEGLPAGNKIVSVAAATTEYVIYEILSGNEDGVIQIDPFSGDLVTAQELDYEKSPQYKLHVNACDSKGRTAEANVVINVQDINDNSPFFIDSIDGQIDRKVEAGIREGDEVTQIEAYDLDEESSMEYKLSSEAEAFFSIDNEGVIRAKRTLDGNIPGKRATDPLSTLSFNVEATDRADPPNRATTPVRLAFANYKSGQSALAVKVPENARVGTTIAEAPRYIPGGTISILYPERAPFTVDKAGRVRLASELDFETQAKYVLTIREQGWTDKGPMVNDVDLEISVEDANDNDPRFQMKVRRARLNGNSRAGVKAFNLQVSDADSGPNGLAGYQLMSTDTPFGINPLDDTVEVGGILTKNQYDLEIHSFDYGIPRRQNAPFKLILDVGQLPPRFIDFQDDGYKFEVPEDAKGGTVIGKIAAVSVSGSRIGYAILEGNTGNNFIITENGEIRLNSLMDYETQAREYDLVVEAIELVPLGLSSTINVKISVLNANDHHPVFEQGSYKASVREDVAVGTSILTVSATDCDCSEDCSCTSGQLVFSVIDSEYFNFDPDTGILSNVRSLDYESKKTHIFKIEVSDTLRNDTKFDVAFVNITLSNTNDNQPHFEFPEYRFTVDEEAEVGRGLGAVVAQDSDHGSLSYSIVAGSGPFQIDARTGIISLRQTLPSQPWEYTLTIRASDSGISDSYSDTKVIIFIKDKNNNRPEFEKCEDGKVTENRPAGQVVTQVLATDKDRGRNGEVEYSIVYGDEHFEIDNTTGVIRSTVRFDREDQPDYMVVIKAEDGGHGQSSSQRLLRYCKVRVTIEDLNDNYPNFPTWHYEGSVWQNAEVGTSIITVHAFDSDSDVNSKVEYRFVEANDKLEISDRGVISTKASLKSFLGTLTYYVIASNTEPMTVGETKEEKDERKTRINIYVSELQPPKFTKSVFKGSVTENSKPDTFIVQISATSMNNKPLTYSPLMTWRDASEFFHIDPNTGVITSGGSSFDREWGSTFRMQFRARESDQLFSTCLVEIDVKDINDNSPKFVTENYDGRVLENSPRGTDVIRVHANDADTGAGAEVTYRIDPAHDSQYFTIDAITGIISTAETFDREITEQKHFLLVIEASDKGIPPLSSHTYVDIEVVDDNDMGPTFEPTQYSLTVDEDVPLGEVLYFFTVKDADVGLNAIVNFFISEGNQEHVFDVITKISPNGGELVVEDKLDYETTKAYTLKIIATDGRSASQPATVSIKVRDVNDNAPVFTQLRYQATVVEGTKRNQAVLTVSATDIDTTKEDISYTLDQEGQQYFTIGRESGEIRTGGRPLNREKTPVLNFKVLASDGKFTGVAGIKIVVLDVNDQAPYFPNPPYVGTVEENKPPGTSVIVVQAVDEDDPSTASNTKIKYNLDDDSDGKFVVDETTALISTTVSFDREKDDTEYNITIRATDLGNPPLSGTTVVTIRIQDANDHKPQFDPKEYRASVPENAYPAYYVTTVNATDGDIGFNAAFEFTIVSGNEPYAFYIEPDTGRIMVSGELDFESKRSYTLQINVSDQGIPQLTTSELATVFITILDANDHPPVFVPDEYRISVLENLTVGTSLLSLTTTDGDTAIETQLFFEVIFGDRADIFDVKPDPNSRNLGILYTTAALDRETLDTYMLEIRAKDEDGLFDICSVTVTVMDVNDNGPHFMPPFYVGSIFENNADLQFVVTLRAYDPDEPSNGPPFSYKILNGTVDGNFVIRPGTADIYSNGTFRYEEKQEWKIWVQATDSGNPSMTNVTVVYIRVKDAINDNEPFNASMTIVLNAYQGQFAGGKIGKVYYQDNDFEVDENGYKIVSQNPGSYFTIDSKTGNLSAPRDIPIGYYGLFVQIREKNRNVAQPKVVFSAVNVIVQNISQTAVRMSSTVQFVNIYKESIFVGDYYSLLNTGLTSFLSSEVFIFSIQKDPVNPQAINVQFTVRNDLYPNGFMSSTEVLAKLVENKDSLQQIGITIGAFGIDNCAQEMNITGVCKNTVKADYAFTVISGDHGQFPAPPASLTFVSMDLQLVAEYESIIKPRSRTCVDNPCLHNGTCHDVEPHGFICQCKHKFYGLVPGPLCEETTRTFEGGLGTSYIWLQTLAAYERNVVQLEFTTNAADGLLLYQGPLMEVRAGESRDFMAVVLYDGFIRVVISLGADPLILTMSLGARLDDGEWHFVEVRQELKIITVIVDRCKNAQLIELGDELVEDESDCKISGKIRGSHYYLNSLSPLQIGGVENPVITYPNLNYTGFNGCIRRVTNNKHMYDLKSPLKVVNSPEGCEKAESCPNCNYQGYCEPHLNKKSVCVCDVGYSGQKCRKTAVGNFYQENSYSQYSVTSWDASYTSSSWSSSSSSSSSWSSSTSSRRRREVTPAPQPITSEYFTDIALKIKAKPGTNDSLIFLSTNSLGTEFVRVDLHNGVVRCIFRLAGRTKILQLPGVNVTDNKYHTVIIERLGNYATLQVDYAGKVEGSTGGTTHLMNHGGGALFAGGLRRLTALKVMQAIVKSHGKAIVQTASGSLISTYSAFSGSSLSGVSLITINSQGHVHVKKIKNATLIRMYQKHTIRSVFNSSAQRIVIGSAGVSVTQVQVGNSSLQSVQKIIQRRHQQNAGAAASGGTSATIGGNAVVIGGKLKGAGNYGSRLMLSQTGGGQNVTREGVDESYGGCIPQNRLNGFDMDENDTIHFKVGRQNVVFGCPCETGECANNGTCMIRNISTPLVNTTTSWNVCKCVGDWTGPRCQEEDKPPGTGDKPTVRPPTGPSWFWKAVLAFLLLLLIFLLLLGLYLLWKRCKSDAVDGTPPAKAAEAAPTGHGTVRSYSDVGAGEEDSTDYDLRHLMKYMYTEKIHGGLDLEHSHEHASIRVYKDSGVPGTDNHQFDLRELMSYKHHVIIDKVGEKPLGTNNPGFHGSMPAVTSGLHSVIVQHVMRADSHPSLSHDEIHSFEDEGLDSDVDDLSHLGSGDEEDWDQPDDWESFFVGLGRV